ncbi:MAG: T9SS type A sorting domain-containing protein [Bacteroidetes bacterium]|nr:T9SS type A sorting domain-containing protein [Bacteroidota bacterium]
MKKLLSIVLIFFIAANFAKAEANFITAYEGLATAKETVISKGIKYPRLISVDWSNSIIIGITNIKSVLKTEGKDIGKATEWIYTFVDATETTNKIIYILVSKNNGTISGLQIDKDMGPQFGYDYKNSIELNEKNDSPKMVEQLVQDPIYIDYLNDITNDPVRYWNYLTIRSLYAPYKNLESNTNYWAFGIIDYEMKAPELLCSVKVNLLSLNFDGCSAVNSSIVNCVTYGGSSIEAKNIDISISPNPASENINIYIPVEYENSISNIELFDINGNLLDNINSYNYNAANLPNGTYYICFTINNCKYYRAFIIAN